MKMKMSKTEYKMLLSHLVISALGGIVVNHVPEAHDDIVELIERWNDAFKDIDEHEFTD